MKPQDYIIALLLTVAFIFALICLQNRNLDARYVQGQEELKTQLAELSAKVDELASKRPAQVNNIILDESFASYWYDRAIEFEAKDDYLRWWDEFWGTKYDAEGHQERYMEIRGEGR